MDSMKIYMLNKVIAWLLSGEVFDEIKKIVFGLASTDATGEEKRKMAISRAKTLLGSISVFMINLGIEAAVFMLKAQAEKNRNA